MTPPSTIKVGDRLLIKVEKILDDFNGEHGNVDNGGLCQWCWAVRFDAKQGIVHDSDCIILELREAIAQPPED